MRLASCVSGQNAQAITRLIVFPAAGRHQNPNQTTGRGQPDKTTWPKRQAKPDLTISPMTTVNDCDQVSLTARMMLAMQLLQSGVRDVRVDLRRCDVAVAEQHLDDPEIRAMIEQMRRERMPQRVR